MKRSSLTVLPCLMFFAIGSLSARPQKDAKSNPLAGAWDCVAHGSVQGDVPFTLTLKQDQDSLTGSITTADGELNFTSASYKDGALEIVMDTPDAKYTVNGKLDGDKLSGQWSKEGDDGKQGGPWEGKRSTAAPATSAPAKPTH
jgi:hypothetical protein